MYLLKVSCASVWFILLISKLKTIHITSFLLQVRETQALILSPTRELAVQVQKVCISLNSLISMLGCIGVNDGDIYDIRGNQQLVNMHSSLIKITLFFNRNPNLYLKLLDLILNALASESVFLFCVVTTNF